MLFGLKSWQGKYTLGVELVLLVNTDEQGDSEGDVWKRKEASMPPALTGGYMMLVSSLVNPDIAG